MRIGYVSMRYAMHESRRRRRPALRLRRSSRSVSAPSRARMPRPRATRCSTCSKAAAERRSPASATSCAPGTALFVARGNPWSADGDAHAVSVLAHDPPPASATHAVVDLTAVDEGTATAGREFLLGATPEVGCGSVDAVHRPDPARPCAGSFSSLRRGDLRPRRRGLPRDRRRAGARSCRVVHPSAAHARPLPREHGRRRDARARSVPTGGLPRRGLLPRRHPRRPARRT